MGGKAKYMPGMRLGNFQCPNGQVGILMLERIAANRALFECPYCHEAFEAQIGQIVNGRAHACHEHSKFPYVPGDRIGDFVNPDGSIGMEFVKKIYDENGYATKLAEFICPISGRHFNAEISAVKNGLTRTAPEYAHNKYNPGNMLGMYDDIFTGETYSVEFVERLSKTDGVFRCHYCGDTYETRIKSVVEGHSPCCKDCYKQIHRKYPIGTYIGTYKNKAGDCIGTKIIRYVGEQQAIFECPECHEHYQANVQSVIKRTGVGICPKCDTRLYNRKFRLNKLLGTTQPGHTKKSPDQLKSRRKNTDYFHDNTQPRSYGPLKKVHWLAGKRCGHITALYPLDGYSKSENAVWMCRCDCGNLCKRSEITLLSKNDNISCGCVSHKTHDKKLEKNYEGLHQGNITVLKKIGVYDGYMRYRCKCECEFPCDEQLFTVRADKIASGIECKPGCQKSIGEARIEQILRDLCIRHKTQASFDTLINPKTGKKLFCDFYLPDYKMVIEFDGRQHYQEGSQWGGKMRVVESMYYDGVKNQWCADNGITMVRITYCYRDDLNADFIKRVINDAKGKKLVMLPMKNKNDDQRLPIMHQMLANVISAVAEQKRLSEN